MKEKFSDKSLANNRKIQILTLAPASWPRASVATFFNVSEHMVREARKLAKEKGILELPKPKQGKGLSKEVEESIKLFYEDDEFSRLMSGAKDFVSIGKKVHKQKRLLLYNSKEMYLAYKEKFPDHKVGLSKFCELRPKWCIAVSSAGTHSVCVCTIHKNTKLMVDAFCNVVNKRIKKLNRSKEQTEGNEGSHSSTFEEIPKFEMGYRDLMAMVVCDVNEMECMVHRCEIYPGFESLKQIRRV